jgi:hypothetical protein
LELINNKKKVIFPPGIDFKQWQKHCIACKSIIYELYCIYNNKSLLSYFI